MPAAVRGIRQVAKANGCRSCEPRQRKTSRGIARTNAKGCLSGELVAISQSHQAAFFYSAGANIAPTRASSIPSKPTHQRTHLNADMLRPKHVRNGYNPRGGGKWPIKPPKPKRRPVH